MTSIKSIWSMGVSIEDIHMKKTIGMRKRKEIHHNDIVLKNGILLWLDRYGQWQKTRIFENESIIVKEVKGKILNNQPIEKAFSYSTSKNIITYRRTSVGTTATKTRNTSHAIIPYSEIQAKKSDFSNIAQNVYLERENQKKILRINRKFVRNIISKYNEIFSTEYPEDKEYTKQEILQILRELWGYTHDVRYKAYHDFIDFYLFPYFLLSKNGISNTKVAKTKTDMKKYYHAKIHDMKEKEKMLLAKMKNVQDRKMKHSIRRIIRNIQKQIRIYSVYMKNLK